MINELLIKCSRWGKAKTKETWVPIVTYIKEKTKKCNHAQELKYKNKVAIKCNGNHDTHFICKKKEKEKKDIQRKIAWSIINESKWR